jgi:hypothetical protein
MHPSAALKRLERSILCQVHYGPPPLREISLVPSGAGRLFFFRRALSNASLLCCKLLPEAANIVSDAR